METVVHSRVERVELFEDRAAITRTVTVEAGRHTLRVGPLSPLIDPSRLSAPREAGDADWILEDARVDRERRKREHVEDEAVTALRGERDEARRRLGDEHDRSQRAASSVQRGRKTLKAARRATAAALQAGEEAAEWVASLESLTQAAEQRALDHADAKHRADLAAAELQRIESALDEALAGTTVEEASLVVQIHARSAGTIRLRYVVPCALWRPTHRATLEESTGRLHWEIRAACWNGTGEDWSDVELVCSTARPGQHAEAPTLVDDVVTTTRRSTEILVEAREEVVEHARVEGAVKVEATLPGVDDGGEARVYVVRDRVSLPSDGRPVFIGLQSFETEAEVSWHAVPLLLGQAVLRSVAVNPTERPLLAGPVELIRAGLFVGSANLGLVAAGERFELGWGSHDGLRLVRKQTHDVDYTVLTGSQTHTFEVEVRVSHLGTDPVVLQIDERLPVSELKQVTVTLKDSAPALTRRPDDDGLCGWRLELQPRQTRTFSLVYTVVASRNIALPF